LPTIDGLRGVAIITVVGYHVWQVNWQGVSVFGLSLQPFIETGFLGVDLFFFISGFVLMLPYAAGAPPTPGEFARHRWRKIAPSYLLCLVVLLAVGYDHVDAKDVVFHLLFVYNWFAQTSGSIDGVMWSLADEVQFYLLVPILAPLFARRPLLVAGLLFGVANGWRCWCLLSSHYFYTLRLQQLPAVIDLFAAGMLAATWACGSCVAERMPANAARRQALYSLLMIGGTVLALALMNDCFAHRSENEWPNFWVVRGRSLLALAFVGVAVGSLGAVRPLQSVLANPPLLFAATISYNLYLWHQPIARALLSWHVPPYSGDPHDDHRWQFAFWFAALGAGVAVATLLTYGVERPFLRRGRLTPALRRRQANPMPKRPSTGDAGR
jgi:peptidoglycan/LPS O-acetylase OafA/YrhL